MLIPLRFLFYQAGTPVPSTEPHADTYISHGPPREAVESVCEVLVRYLGVDLTPLWSTDELEGYVTEGYNQLTLATGCLWATDVAPDFPASFSVIATFEKDFLIGGDWANGPFQFTMSDERNFVDNSDGPANHNHPWEFNDDYVIDAEASTEIPALVDLPVDLYEIERATWDTRRLDSLRSRAFEGADDRYELNKGPVDAYTQDKDGLRRLRKWRVPSAPYVPFEHDTDSTLFGYYVQIPDIDPDVPQGVQVGDFVTVDGQFAMGDLFGIIVGFYRDAGNVRYEYRRRGTNDGCLELELADRYQTYVRHYAMSRALEREGDGQDLELAAHYQLRYEAGVQRMLRRKTAMNFQRKFVLGGRPSAGAKLPMSRLPWQYGEVVR